MKNTIFPFCLLLFYVFSCANTKIFSNVNKNILSDTMVVNAGNDTICYLKHSLKLNGTVNMYSNAWSWRVLNRKDDSLYPAYLQTAIFIPYDTGVYQIQFGAFSNQFDYTWHYDTMKVNVIFPPKSNDYKISLSPYAKFWNGDTVFYQLNDLTASDNALNLINNQNSDPLNGIMPIYSNNNTFFSSGYAGHIDYPTIAVIDLGGYYELTHEMIDFSSNTATVCIQYGSPYSWSKDTLKADYANEIYDFGDTIKTRYLKIFYDTKLGGYEKVRQLFLYGHLLSDSASRTQPPLPLMNYSDGKTMSNFMGVNQAGVIPPPILNGIAGIFRDYTNQYYLDTSHIHNVDSVNFVFSKFSANSTPVSYFFPGDTGGLKGLEQYYSIPAEKDSGMYAGYNRTSEPYYLPALQAVNQMESDSGWYKNIDYTNHPYADSTNPASYDRLSRMAWMIGAAFGKNKYPSDSLQFTLPAISGLNNAQYIETGNENNGGWKGLAYYSPQAFIAYSSAFYDGDNGRMGSKFGIKNSDSSIQVLMAGDASNNRYDYMNAMRYWSYYSIPNHKIPFDIYNFHDYEYIKGKPHSAFEPENYNTIGFSNIRTYWQSIVDSAKQFCPRCGVWNTEWGYDRNGSLENAVAQVNGQDSAEVQANWIARSWILQSFVKGLDASVYYMFGNSNVKDYDSGAYNNYSTCGLTDQHVTGDPAKNGACCATNFYAFPAYYFQSTIFNVLHNYRPDSIIYENGLEDSIYCYRYVNVNNPDSVAYVYWSGTMSNKTITGYYMKVGSSNEPISNVLLKNKYLYGDTSNLTADNSGNVPITISETPNIILFTLTSLGGEISHSVLSNLIVNAGTNVSLLPSDTSYLLSGAAFEGGDNYTYEWTQITGPPVIIYTPDSLRSVIGGLVSGRTYGFKLTVKDNNGNMDSDNVFITVLPVNSQNAGRLYLENGKLIFINQ